MMLKAFSLRWTTSMKLMSGILVGLAIMIVANLFLAVKLYTQDTTTILLPPALDEQGEISSTRANEAVLSAWGLAVANLVGNVSPPTFPFVRDTLQTFMVPSSFQRLSTDLDRQARDLELDQHSLSFSALNALVDMSRQQVTVTGRLTTHGLRNQRSSEIRTYVMHFRVRNHMVQLEALESFEGSPQRGPQREETK